MTEPRHIHLGLRRLNDVILARREGRRVEECQFPGCETMTEDGVCAECDADVTKIAKGSAR